MENNSPRCFAMVGAGGFVAERHMQAIRDTGSRLVAAMDPHDSVGVMDRYFPAAEYFGRLEDLQRFMAARRNNGATPVEYLSVCSPNHVHEGQVRMALENGAHAICEKPLVLDPRGLDRLAALEQQHQRQVSCTLQLRKHPAVQALHASRAGKGERAEVVLSYVLRRGPWFLRSWQGDDRLSGGITMNIGLHFFDMLQWTFGAVESSEVHLFTPDRVAGLLELEGARVRWFLSVNGDDLPAGHAESGQHAHRSILIDGEELDFSTGFEDLHTRAYEDVFAGKGLGIEDARPGIELVQRIREATPVTPAEPHPYLEEIGLASSKTLHPQAAPATDEPVPFIDLSPEIDELWPEITTAVNSVLRSGRYILGPEVNAFEEEAAKYLNVKHAIGVNSGTDALTIALRALGVGPGDEVITTPFTFIATAEAVSLVGATPVFVDIDPETFCLDPVMAEAAINERTKAILPVHLFGHSADMDPILALAKRRGLKVLEDAAQVFGGTYKGANAGGIGDAAAFSFYPTKNLGAFGDGGLITTNDDTVAESVRMLRGHGSKGRELNQIVGYNSRLDEIQAAILRVKLPHLDEMIAKRRAIAARYDAAFAELEDIVAPPVQDDVMHVYHQYTVRVRGGMRDAVRQALTDAKIGSMLYYQIPVHRLPVYADGAPTLEVAETAADEVLSLPVWPTLSEAGQQRCVETISGCLAELQRL